MGLREKEEKESKSAGDTETREKDNEATTTHENRTFEIARSEIIRVDSAEDRLKVIPVYGSNEIYQKSLC